MQNTENRSLSQVSVENSRFMSSVYAWMTLGLFLTAGISWGIGQNEELALSIISNRILYWALIIAQLGAVFALVGFIQRIKSITALFIYLVYAMLTGVTLSVIFLAYSHSSIYQVFGITACAFAGLSAFGYVTKRDLGPVGSFCMMGLFGLIAYGLLALIFPSMMGEAANFVYSMVGIVVFSGLTAYDTQKIKQLNMGNEGSDLERKEAIIGALTLYLDFINLFLNLLRLMGRRK